ncbi:hypothetical protein [Pseudomonas sp. NEEL19]|uniref:hypothetical protein n=1 Tax=Pseudomonas sp. NEEL19 TaxID=2867409 RepID=UPI002367B287|nr:hypothetical protein [Pseudomonas sp. NEEL19]
MSTTDTPPSTLRGIRRKATKLKREKHIPHNEALDAAARESGFQDFHHARRSLQRGFPAPDPKPNSTPTEPQTSPEKTREQGTVMGIKMNLAKDQHGREWDANTYHRGMGAEPLMCTHCGVAVTHNPSHTREMYDKSVLVPGYFRLLPKGAHASHCRFGVDEEVDKIAMESEGLIESIQRNKYRMRLVMIKEALEGGSIAQDQNSDGSRAKTGRTYTRNPNLLPAYINSATRALKLRALCASNQDIEQHLELIFEGNVKVSWDQFYYETERHMEAFHAVSQNVVQHPIAIQGNVKSVRRGLKGDASKNVLNLQMNPFRIDQDDADNGIGLEVSVWSRETAWFNGIEDGDDVVVLGVWKSSITPPSAAPREGGRFKTLTKRRLSLSLVLKPQISKVQ